MNDTSVVQEVLHAGVFLIIGAVVTLAGWNEPLRYLFMNQQQIIAEEKAMFASPGAPSESKFSWRPGGTALDRGPWKLDVDNRTLIYTENVDAREMGSRTEAGHRRNLSGPGR